MNPRDAHSLAELLIHRARHESSRLAYGFLDDGERPGATLTYGQLGEASANIAAALARCADGPVLLLFPPGLELIAALWGVLRAGRAVVPAPVASPLRLGRSFDRLVAMGEHAGFAAILTSERFRAAVAPLAAAMAAAISRPVAILATDQLATDTLPAETGDDPLVDGETVALLQYTSGSTSHPRAAVVRHRNLLHNLAAIDACQRNDAESVSLSWLPIFHDLGLIAGVLHPLYRGCPAWLMAPAAFLQRPLRWLEAIGLLRATQSGGPNFAFDLCVARTRPEQRAGLDLRSWRYAHLGGEMVRAGTLSAFCQAFAPAGFHAAALKPGYGLAEATLIVSAGCRGERHKTRELSRRALANGGWIQDPEGPGDTLKIVACGAPVPDTEVAVVDPDRCVRREPGTVGEIWVRGPSVTAGYWRDLEATAATFEGRLHGDTEAEARWLRTGDLGFLADGELWITGRLKDLIIVRGVNFYPQDLELTVEQEANIQPGGSAAFAVPGEQGEDLVLIAEVLPDFRLKARDEEGRELMERLRERVGLEHEVQVSALVLLEPGGLLKTTSGKVRRQACRAAYLDGSLAALQSWCPAALQAAHTASRDGAS